MKQFSVKLNCGNYAVIQSCSLPKVNQSNACIGIILPGRKVIEFFKLRNWDFSYDGTNNIIKNQLLNIYNTNKTIIKKKVVSLMSE